MTGELSNIAEIEVPSGYLFIEGDATRRLLELTGNPTSGMELGALTSADDESYWFVIFEFSDVGYVDDEDQHDLDADAMLNDIRAGNARANELRRKRGWSELYITGWEQEPRYDPVTNNLQWAIRGTSEGEPVLNFNTRILGRRGVVEVGLVTDPVEMATALPEFQALMKGFDYKTGNRYADFVRGDRVADFGLTTLVVGGGAALAAKTGLLAKFWKFIVAGVVAIGGFLRRLLGGGNPQSA